MGKNIDLPLITGIAVALAIFAFGGWYVTSKAGEESNRRAVKIIVSTGMNSYSAGCMFALDARGQTYPDDPVRVLWKEYCDKNAKAILSTEK